MNSIDEYWKILDKNMEWVKISDAKATLVLTVYGVMLTVIYSDAQYIVQFVENKSLFSLFFLGIAALLSMISIIYAFLCINPRTKNINPHSIIYFGHIAAKFKKPSEYLEFAEQVLNDEVAYKKELSEQIFVNAVIAEKKFEKVTYSIRCFFASLLVFVLAVCINLFK